MKKLISVILFAVMILSLASVCFAANSPIADELITNVNVPSIQATVISSSYNAEKDRFSFCAIADLTDYGYPNSTAEPFTFGVARENYIDMDSNIVYDSYYEGDGIEPGTVVKIFWGGEFMESYPMQLGTVNFVINSGDVAKLSKDEFEEYYLMFYIELPDVSDYPSSSLSEDSQIAVEDDETEENPDTGITVNPMKTILVSFAVLSIASIGIYLISALRKS